MGFYPQPCLVNYEPFHIYGDRFEWLLRPLKRSRHTGGGGFMRALGLFLLALLVSGNAGAADFAYQAPGSQEVALRVQARLISRCGQRGESCECRFHSADEKIAPLNRALASLSVKYRTARCSLPEGHDSSRFEFAELRTRDGRFASHRLRISARVSPGMLGLRALSGVYRYECRRTFFEGEGVSEEGYTCPASQRLGVINATYTHYLFRRQDGRDNFAERQKNTGHPLVCDYSLAEFSCAQPNTLSWILSADPEGEFQTLVSLSPRSNTPAQVYGFAALPDEFGNCGAGLMKVKPWAAVPLSITEGSIDGTNPPSRFDNSQGALNQVRLEEKQPKNFPVFRLPNHTPCAAEDSETLPPGSCRRINFKPIAQVQSVPYEESGQALCVAPASLTGL